MKLMSAVFVSIVGMSLNACSSDSQVDQPTASAQKAEENPNVTPSTQSSPASTSPSTSAPVSEQTIRASSPKSLLARVKVSDLNSKSGLMEMVSLNLPLQNVTASDLSKLFNSGQKLNILQGSKGLEAVSSKQSILLTAGSKTLQNLGNVIQVGTGLYPSVFGYGYPTGGNTGVFGGVLNILGSLFGGAIGTIGHFLQSLLPVLFLGQTGLGYNGSTSYPYEGNQYFPYNQGATTTPTGAEPMP